MYIKIIFTIMIVLISCSIQGCDNSEISVEVLDNLHDNYTTQMSRTNLDGLSVYSSLNSISYNADGEMINLDSDEILLFVNGSIAPLNSAYYLNNTTLVSVDTIAEIFNAELNYKSDNEISFTYQDSTSAYNFELIHNRAFIALDSVIDVFHCNAYYCDTNTLNDEYMIQSYPHAMIYKYPTASNIITKEEAVIYLKEQLIKAYENKFGIFEALTEASDEYSEKDNLRYIISTLDEKNIKCENNRFYIIEFIYDFYVDKYSDDIFTHYIGFDETFDLFEPYSDYALSFPG